MPHTTPLCRCTVFSFTRLLTASCILTWLQIPVMAQSPVDLVNPFVGTDAHGHTFPGATTPFGMVQLSPDTRTEGWDACGGYHYSDSTILGFSHTHLSGTGIPDYGDILFLPSTKPPGQRRSQRFGHRDELASPGYYRVLLRDDSIDVELTASPRVGMHRYTFPASTTTTIVIDLRHGLGPDRVTESYLEAVSNAEIAGYRRSTGWAKDQHIYFVAQFSKPFEEFGAVDGQLRGTDVRGVVRFTTTAGESILIKVGISSVDLDGARKNLSEIPHWDFDRAVENARELWRKELGTIEIEGGSDEQRRTFYTALYHAMIAPNLANDVDGRYRGMDGVIRSVSTFEMYTVFSLWDTFRALHPLLTVIDTKRTRAFLLSMLAKYRESGALPVWELASNETRTMIGYHSIPVIADAYVKGVRGFDADEALSAMVRSARQDDDGLKAYRQFGFIPGDAEGESVSKTLEYAYDDWCIAALARLRGKPDLVREFTERAQYYRNLYDPTTGFMRPRINGHWVEPFDPRSVTVHYTEANAWQYSLFAPHDPAGLLALAGGPKQFEARLDSLFHGSSHLTGRAQADITGLIGQYAQGNEPSHHFAYLYNYTPSPWKTQILVRTIMDSLYSDRPDGLCGNDDCGQMSAWYVFSALGFYPVTPGTTKYHLASPLFTTARIHLENGRTFTVRTRGKGMFIQNVRKNSRVHASVLIDHADILNGANLEIEVGARPDSPWNRSAFVSNPEPLEPPITAAPFFVSSGASFRDSVRFEIRSATPGAAIFVRPESYPDFVPYTSPVTLHSTTLIEAYAVADGHIPSKAVRAEFVKFRPVGSLHLESVYSYQYTGGGDDALVDGRRGGPDFRLGAWQGYEGNDLIAVLDLGETRNIETVGLGCLQDENSWIFFPAEVQFSFSTDGSDYTSPIIVPNDVSQSATGAILKEFTAPGKAARFVRIHARTIGVCPPWHKGAGGKAWLFADEIVVKLKK